jgi:two-component system, NtrC family, sensor kinase
LAKLEDICLLLVDDEEDFRRTVARRLERRGIRAEQAGNGLECLSLLDKKPAHVVVLDVKMPGMDGLKVLEEIKAKCPKTEVILLTGHTTLQDGIDGIKCGAFDYLSKPVELEHLVGKIRQAYEKILREEEKAREAEFRAKMEHQMTACERLASLGTLAAGVAHEINNPLAIMKESAGWMKLLLGKTADLPRRQDFERALDKIEKSIERAKRITHQLLGMARKGDSLFSEFSLGEIVEEAIALVSKGTLKKDIEFVQEIEPGLRPLWSDPYQLRQVLVNLLTNAVHATERGGRITVSCKDADDKVTLVVQDTGQGIPKENLERIFEPFFTTKSPGEGTGLGLFVSRGIVEKLGGTIGVASQVGEGTRFTITLPKAFNPEQALKKEGDSTVSWQWRDSDSSGNREA